MNRRGTYPPFRASRVKSRVDMKLQNAQPDHLTRFLNQFHGKERFEVDLGLTLIGLDDLYEQSRSLPFVSRVRVRAMIRGIVRELDAVGREVAE